MKKVLFNIIGSLLVIFAYGQGVTDQPVAMKYVYSFDEAIEKANQENKLIFFNCFADWAIPCHAMNSAVFNNTEFADFMDKNFVSLFVEMVGTPEGQALAKMYEVKTFAQYLVLNADGEVVHRIVGGSKLPEFQEEVALALNPETSLIGIQKRFQAGERSVDFLRQYLKTIRSAGLREEYAEVSKLFLEKLPKEELPKKENWFIVAETIDKPTDEMFQYLVEHKAEFLKYNDTTMINNRMSAVCLYDFYQYATGEQIYNQEEFKKQEALLERLGLPATDQLFVVKTIAYYRGEKQYDEMFNTLEKGRDLLEQRVIAPAIELSFSKIRDYSPAQKERIMAFLRKQQEGETGSTLRNYQQAVDEIANYKGIIFDHLTFQDALKKAKAEKKMIFMDCYTTWCGPCRTMSDQVFTQRQVGDPFNQLFVNLKIDMEKGEGKELLKKYDVRCFPTMLILDSDGNLLHRIIGAMDAKTLVNKTKRGVNPMTCYREVKKKYETGDRSPQLMASYLLAMEDAGELKDGPTQINTFLKGLSIAERCQEMPWLLLTQQVKNQKDPLFQDIITNKDEYEQHLGAEIIYKELERIYFPVLLAHLTTPLLDSELETIQKDFKKCGIGSTTILGYLNQLIKLYDDKQYSDILNIYKNNISGIEDAQGKLNLDLLLSKLVEKAPAEERKEALQYARSSFEKSDDRAKNGYQGLIRSLNNLPKQ